MNASPPTPPPRDDPKTTSEEPRDLRCPHCNVIVVKKERFDPSRPNFGAPDFCGFCGEKVAAR